jgi:transcription termination factor Rho
VRHLRHLQNAAVDLAVGVFDAAERLHWRIVRARTAAVAPIAGAVAILTRRRRPVRGGLPQPDPDRVRVSVVPRVLVAVVGLVAIAAISTALAPSSSSEAVPRPNAGVPAQKAPKSTPSKRVARAPAVVKTFRTVKPATVRVRAVSPQKARVSATTTPPAVERRVVKGARVERVQRPKSRAPVTTPPPPSPQPVSPAPQSPPAGDTNDTPPEDENSGPGGGNGDDENSGPGGGNEDEENGGGKGKDEKDKDKDKGEDEDEDEDNGGQPQPPPPPPNDEDDDRGA